MIQMEKNQTILLPPEAQHDKERYVRWLHPAVSLRFVASQSHSTLSPHWEKVGTFNCLTALRVQVLLLPLGGFHI